VNRSLASIALALVLVCSFALAPLTALAAPSQQVVNRLSVPITGTLTDAQGAAGTFVGRFGIQRFTVQNGQLAAVGTLTGTLTNATGGVIGTVSQSATMPVAVTAATCQILNLVLGPLDLNLLGLHVDLNQVLLNITGDAGPGQLVGQLLCAIANLLNGGVPAGLSSLLNFVVALIRL
jgi:hypothetical protein